MIHTAMLIMELQKEQRKRLTAGLPQNKSVQKLSNLKVYGQPYDPRYTAKGVTVYYPRIDKSKPDGSGYVTYLAMIHVNMTKLLYEDDHVSLLTTNEEVERAIKELDRILQEIFKGLYWEYDSREVFGESESDNPEDYMCRQEFEGLYDRNISLNRIDFTTQLYDMPQETMDTFIRCLNKGDLSKLDVTGQREGYKMFHGSAYIETDSVNINIYDKQNQMLKTNEWNSKHGNKPKYSEDDIEAAGGILRVEIQCKSRKLLEMSRKKDILKTLYRLATKEISREVITYYLELLTGTQDYYAIDTIQTKIKNSRYRPATKQKMSDIIVKMNEKPTTRLSDVKNELKKTAHKSTVNGYIKRIEELGCNPVPLAKNGIRHLPNLMTLIKDQWEEEDSEVPW